MYSLLKLFCICAVAGCAQGWGPSGHRIVADIGEKLLDFSTHEKVNAILSSSMASVATWADDIDHKPEFAWTKCMHYIDSDTCSINMDLDCPNGCCVINAIGNFTNQLTQSFNDEPLKFLIHFMGDIHQPLHAGHRSDKGGNMISVVPIFHHGDGLLDGGHGKNLHEVWDSVMIEEYLHEHHSGQWEGLSEELLAGIKNGTYSDNQKCPECTRMAAEESAKTACVSAYQNQHNQMIKSGDSLDREYFEDRIRIVHARLALAGIRLANLLNHVVEGAHAIPETMYI